MIDISVVSEGSGRRIQLLDESTGASEEIFLEGIGVSTGAEAVAITVQDEDDLSGRHHYSP